MLHKCRQQQGNPPINQRDGQVRLPVARISTGHRTCRIGQFGQTDGRGQRGILDDGNGVIAQRRQHAPKRLRQDHLAQRLHIGHAERARSLALAAVNRLDAGAENLRHIGPRVERDSQYRRGKCAILRADFARQITADDPTVARVDQHWHERKVNQQNLHKQGRATYKADIKAYRPLHRITQEIFPETMTRLGQATDTQHQTPAGTGDHTDERGLDGHPRAFDKQRQVFADDFPIKERIHECNPGKQLPATWFRRAGSKVKISIGLLQWQCRHVGVEPFLVDLGVGTVGNDFLQACIDFVLQFLVALFNGNAEILASELGITNQLELFLWMALDVELDHADITHSRIHTTAIELFEHQRGVVETMNGGIGLADFIGDNDIARTGIDYADLQFLQLRQPRYLGTGSGNDDLLCWKIRQRKINHLGALVGNGDARDDDVAVALRQSGKYTFPRGADQLDLETGNIGNGLDDVDVETDQFFLRRFKFERTIGATGADHISWLSGGGRGCSQCQCQNAAGEHGKFLERHCFLPVVKRLSDPAW